VTANFLSSTPRLAIGVVLIGTATGLRSQLGVAAILNGFPDDRIPRLLRRRSARTTAAMAALAELVVDKRASTPARTDPGGLIPRIALGGLCGGLLARASGAPTIPFAALGAGAAVGAAFGGIAARRTLSERMPPVAAAVTEDLVALSLAVVALRITK
jgi:uncharacterized membrane protein